MFKIRSLENFSYQEEGNEKGQGVRDKSKEICELLNDSDKLTAEREFATNTRNKL